MFQEKTLYRGVAEHFIRDHYLPHECTFRENGKFTMIMIYNHRCTAHAIEDENRLREILPRDGTEVDRFLQSDACATAFVMAADEERFALANKWFGKSKNPPLVCLRKGSPDCELVYFDIIVGLAKAGFREGYEALSNALGRRAEMNGNDSVDPRFYEVVTTSNYRAYNEILASAI